MSSPESRSNQPPVLQLNPTDPLVVATRELKPGEEVGLGDIRPVETIGRGHKMATQPIADGEPVRKLGQVIGVATKAIAPGQHIHVHNVEFRASTSDHAIGSGRTNMPILADDKAATFMGIVRPDGTIATRNYIGVLTTVNCSATVARQISDWFRMHPEELAPYPNVDGVVALTHKDGCAGGAESEGTKLLRRTIGGYAKHANFGAVVMVGLGCESNQLPRLVTEGRVGGGPAHPDPGDAGSRRHAQDHRSRGGAHPRAAADRQRREARPRPRRSTWSSACNAAGRTDSPRSPPIRRSASRRTFWCRTAAPQFSRKRRRSTAPSTCCCAAPSATRSARS